MRLLRVGTFELDRGGFFVLEATAFRARRFRFGCGAGSGLNRRRSSKKVQGSSKRLSKGKRLVPTTQKSLLQKKGAYLTQGAIQLPDWFHDTSWTLLVGGSE